MRWVALGVDYEMAGKDLIDSVKLSSEICRGGRVIYTISNRCTRVALTAGADDLEPDGTPSSKLRTELGAAGCLGSEGPALGSADPDAPWLRRLARFVATLDLPLASADRTVRRLHRAGMYRAFRPRPLAAQVALSRLNSQDVKEATSS
mgnify:CR=1 FL=1